MEEAILTIFSSLINQVITYLPLAFISLLTIAIGFLIGKIFSRIIEEIIERTKIEEYIFGKKIIGLDSLFSFLIAISIYLIFIRVGIDLLNIAYISTILESIINFIGRIIIFLISFLIGVGISNFIRKKIEESDIDFNYFVSKILYYVCIYIVLVMTLPILGIDTTILSILFIIVLIALILPISIGIGYAIKDDIKDIIRKYMKKRKLIRKKK
ncbi:MAG: hypothetical protein QXW01_02755 [Candidatus Aenigmatarchaeota archaeon]